MKCIAIVYINSNKLIEDIESIMGYHNFKIIENNNNFRVFTGYFAGNVGKFVDKLNNELEDALFHIEDSIFLIYPVVSDDGSPSMSNIIIKRKGNKYLRKKFIT